MEEGETVRGLGSLQTASFPSVSVKMIFSPCGNDWAGTEKQYGAPFSKVLPESGVSHTEKADLLST